MFAVGWRRLATGRSLLGRDNNEGEDADDRRKPDDQREDWYKRGDLHGLKDKHDELVVDSLFLVEDTLPGADEEEHHLLSANLIVDGYIMDSQVTMIRPSLATQTPPHAFRTPANLTLYALDSLTVSIVTLGASRPLTLTLLISHILTNDLLEPHHETGDDERHDECTKVPLSARHLLISWDYNSGEERTL